MLLKTAAAIIAAHLALIAGPGEAHEGHDHGEPPPAMTATAAPRVEAVFDSIQLVAIVRAGGLDVWLDHLADNAPVVGAKIEVETPTGPMTAEPIGAGLHRLDAPWVSSPGDYSLIFTIVHAGNSDLLVTSLTIPPPQLPASLSDSRADWIERAMASSSWALILSGFAAGLLAALLIRRRSRSPAAAALALLLGISVEGFAQGPSSAPDMAQRLPDGSVFAPKPTQRILAIRTIQAVAASHPRTVALPGRIIPDPDASGVAAASVNGRLIAPSGGLPKLGASVRANDVLAWIEPSLQAIDASDIQQRAGELDQQIAIVRRRVERLTALRDVVAKSQTEEATLELNGLLDRRRRLDSSRRSPEALIAPVSGVIAASHAVQGMIATPNAVIFQIIDPTRLWVEALTYEALPAITAGSGLLPDGRALGLTWRGSGLSGTQQASPVHFAIQGESSGLRPGQLISVHAATGKLLQGIGVPRASVVRGSNGQSLVWEHVSPERFEPRLVRFEPLDGDRVLVLAGVEPGARVVTQGAELLNQVR